MSSTSIEIFPVWRVSHIHDLAKLFGQLSCRNKATAMVPLCFVFYHYADGGPSLPRSAIHHFHISILTGFFTLSTIESQLCVFDPQLPPAYRPIWYGGGQLKEHNDECYTRIQSGFGITQTHTAPAHWTFICSIASSSANLSEFKQVPHI